MVIRHHSADTKPGMTRTPISQPVRTRIETGYPAPGAPSAK
ncbi:MAG: hypothetical protein WD178_08860 [Actinomycetota bacterium]